MKFTLGRNQGQLGPLTILWNWSKDNSHGPSLAMHRYKSNPGTTNMNLSSPYYNMLFNPVQGPPLRPTSIWPEQKTIPTNPVYGPLHATSTWTTIVNPGDKQRLCTKEQGHFMDLLVYNKNKIIK